MGTPASPWATKVLERLADGEWHTLDELADHAVAAVPPGVAFRAGERNRRRIITNTVRSRGDDRTSITTGARVKVREAINVRVHQGTLQRRDRDGVIEIRKRPRAGGNSE